MLPASFFERDVVTVARELLGAFVVHDTPDGPLAGRVVETEAYAGLDDAASHAWRGPRPRLRHLFGSPGTIYVYRSYGLHWCANAVTAPPGHGSAVLLRAVEPVCGVAGMRERRGPVPDPQLANGPGKLCAALGIDALHDGSRWDVGALRLHAGPPLPEEEVGAATRIGITRNVEVPWRFAVRTSTGVSRRV